MTDALQAFRANTIRGDDVVFFFAGHGAGLASGVHLLPTDIHAEGESQIESGSILLQKFLNNMRESGVRFMLSVIDASTNNPFSKEPGNRRMSTAPSGQMIIYTAGLDGIALDKLTPTDPDPNSVFTRVFLKEIVKPGVTVDRMMRNVQDEAARLAKSVGRKQDLAIDDNSTGNFFFKP